MTASDRLEMGICLYVAPEVWPTVSSCVIGFIGGPDAIGTIVGSAHTISVDCCSTTVGAERLLDHHWIVYRRIDPDSRRNAERSFFDAIADRYELEVDANRNRANLRILLQCTGVGHGHRVLDFGCGPGLSVREADELELIGCDASSEMRRRADANGLLVVGPEALHDLAGAFDAVVASYVLHLAVPIEDWLAAAECARLGGRFSANFHKAAGVVLVEGALQEGDSFVLLESESFDHELHGPIRTWERVR